MLCRRHTLDTFKKVLNVAVQLAAGVNAFHARGYIHGDLKPNNIGCRLETSAVKLVKLLDLGLVTKAGVPLTYRAGGLP